MTEPQAEEWQLRSFIKGPILPEAEVKRRFRKVRAKYRRYDSRRAKHAMDMRFHRRMCSRAIKNGDEESAVRHDFEGSASELQMTAALRKTLKYHQQILILRMYNWVVGRRRQKIARLIGDNPPTEADEQE